MRKSYLFIVDPQNDFCTPQGPGGEKAALLVGGADGDMKTNLDWRKSYAEYYTRVIPLVDSILKKSGYKDANLLTEACEAVANAFYSAAGLAGNGKSSDSSHITKNFYAIANVMTGEFQLYKNVEEE